MDEPSVAAIIGIFDQEKFYKIHYMHIKKVLVANRGEIALRIMKTAHKAGISTVAVYSDQDINAPHTKFADEAYSLTGSCVKETYLNAEKILDIARKSGADAIHPGYGFLSENADFAKQVQDANLTWIGPSPEAIAILGDKISARVVARKVGAPLASGTDAPVASANEIADFAKKVGFPIAIKAAYGGGGRGLKVVWDMSEIQNAFDSATRESMVAFGKSECFVEKFLYKPRHIETQCLADAHGNISVISTRDCTTQRRNQKLVEEAPAPFLSQEHQVQIYDASKAILRYAGYIGAGTCEFLLAEDGTLAFLEVNTRLQVEHTVTEEVTGIDLVLEQFKIAQGLPLDASSIDPKPVGHSIEFRINAEDPCADFLPQTGTICTYRPPTGPGIRVDSGVEEGTTVTNAFDSMLAKLIVTAPTRDEAILLAKKALSQFVIDGISTVIPFHVDLLNQKDFTGNPFTMFTSWIESQYKSPPPSKETHTADVPMPDAPSVNIIGQINGKRAEITLPYGVLNAGTQGALTMPPKRKKPKTTITHTENSIVAPMQAVVVSISVSKGQTVQQGDLLCTLEAMKMEQPIISPKNCTVKEVFFKAGDAVPCGSVLIEIG